MPEPRIDRDNGYAKYVLEPIPTIAEFRAQSDQIALERQARRWGLTPEEYKRRTRPHKCQEQSFKKTYGISIYEYEEMHYAQGGKCAICRQEETNGKLLSTDHDHNTGKVRGLLCGKCNKGPGSFEDNIPRLRAALEYLREH